MGGQGPRQIRMGSASSESSMQAALGNLKDPGKLGNGERLEDWGTFQSDLQRTLNLLPLTTHSSDSWEN